MNKALPKEFKILSIEFLLCCYLIRRKLSSMYQYTSSKATLSTTLEEKKFWYRSAYE